MGLNTIKTVLEKKGPDYVDRLLSEEVTVSEKLDTFRILFEMEDGELKFFKKDNSPINIIERTLNDIWEAAVIELPTLIGDTKLPENVRFGVAYTPAERPLRIPYTNLPRYILTDMTKRKKGKIVESYDLTEVTEWAGILCMGRPPLIYKGKLNEDQKRLLIAYDTKNYDGEYDTFSEMVKKIFKTSYSKEDIIEGIIIKNEKNDILQIISYEFDLLAEAYRNNQTSRDFYDIILLSINKFMDSYSFPELISENKEERYLEIINDIFINYYENENISENIEAKYLQSPKYGYSGSLNEKFIKDERVIQILKGGELYESLYKIFLSSFRKYKKPYGLLTETVVDKFNTYVGLISNKTSILPEENLNEVLSKNIAIKALRRRQPDDIDNMRVISSIQRAFSPPYYNIPQGKKKVAVYLTSYLPFTTSQMMNVEQMSSQWNIPVLLAGVSNKRMINGSDFILSDEIVLGQMRSLSNFNKNLIPSFMMLESWSLKEIFQYARPHYEPLIVFTDKGKKSEMAIQLFYEEEIMGGKINVLDEFNLGEMENKEKVSAYRSIEDGNGSDFIDQTPKPIHNFYDQIVNEYRIWEGAILPQFSPSKYPEIK